MSNTGFYPCSEAELAELIAWAAADAAPLELAGSGSKRTLGRPLPDGHIVDLSAFSGVTLYEPNELVLSARAGTPLADIEALLAGEGQHLAFEPLEIGPALVDSGGTPPPATLGGAVATGLAGPRRIQAGSVRDHVLGIVAVTGRGEAIKAGGRVVKNVTGYDLPKLLTGSYGTLAALTDITLKVLPAPEKVRTVIVFGLTDGRAQAAMDAALASPHDVSAAAHLPQRATGRSRIGHVKAAAAGATAIRVEGFTRSVEARCDALRATLAGFGPVEVLHTENSRILWSEVRNLALIREPSWYLLWRLSMAPQAGPKVVRDILGQLTGDALYDWGGGLAWLALEPGRAGGDGGARAIRLALASHGGGHATLIRAPASLRTTVDVFQPQAPPLAALTARIKTAFDPAAVLGRGRMYKGV